MVREMKKWSGIRIQSNNNNNNNNTSTKSMVLPSWHSHYESSPVSAFDTCRTVPVAANPQTKPSDLGCEFACIGCQSLHPPSPFIIISTQSESRYSFYHPTEGRRLSWVDMAGWLHTEMVYCPQTVTHPGTNRAQCRATTLIETNALPLSQITTPKQSQ